MNSGKFQFTKDLLVAYLFAQEIPQRGGDELLVIVGPHLSGGVPGSFNFGWLEVESAKMITMEFAHNYVYLHVQLHHRHLVVCLKGLYVILCDIKFLLFASLYNSPS